MQPSFGIIIRTLSFMGLYPSETHPILQKLKCHILYWTLLVMPTLSITLKVFLGTNISDALQSNFTGAYISNTVAFGFKLVPFIRSGERIKRCADYFGHPRFAAKGGEEEKIIKQCERVCRGISLIFFWSLVLAEVTFLSMAVVDHRLPLEVWLPYDAYKHMAFYPTFLYLGATLIYNGHCGAIIDPLVGGLAYQATCYLRILNYNLQHLDQYGLSKGNIDDVVTFEGVKLRLRRCVLLHNCILDFVSEFEDCFSLCLISQFAGCTLAVCFCFIGFLQATSSVTAFANIFYSIVVSTQIFFYCCFGTLLFEENNEFITAVYMGRWYNYETKVRKVLILMMERTKQPMILRAGKLIDLTLRTFLSILKTSYSLIAVLKS